MHLLVRGRLLEHLRAAVSATKLKQSEVARRLGVTQPRVSDLLRGRVDLFSTDALIDMLARFGKQVRLLPCVRRTDSSPDEPAIGAPEVRATPMRSALMARVRQKGTGPELVVQAIFRRLGRRFTVNTASLPGSPDILDTAARIAVFVHGCYWHRHPGCRASSTPKTNVAFWAKKFEANVRRDRRNARLLRALGFRAVVVWECQTKAPRVVALERRLARFFAVT